MIWSPSSKSQCILSVTSSVTLLSNSQKVILFFNLHSDTKASPWPLISVPAVSPSALVEILFSEHSTILSSTWTVAGLANHMLAGEVGNYFIIYTPVHPILPTLSLRQTISVTAKKSTTKLMELSLRKLFYYLFLKLRKRSFHFRYLAARSQTRILRLVMAKILEKSCTIIRSSDLAMCVWVPEKCKAIWLSLFTFQQLQNKYLALWNMAFPHQLVVNPVCLLLDPG